MSQWRGFISLPDHTPAFQRDLRALERYLTDVSASLAKLNPDEPLGTPAGEVPGSGGVSGGGTPTVPVTLTVQTGVSPYFIRIDGAPKLSQDIAPNWTHEHGFTPTDPTYVPVTITAHASQTADLFRVYGVDSTVDVVITNDSHLGIVDSNPTAFLSIQSRGFLPDELSSLDLWFKASDLEGVVADSTEVDTWIDAHNSVVATGVVYHTNGNLKPMFFETGGTAASAWGGAAAVSKTGYFTGPVSGYFTLGASARTYTQVDGWTIIAAVVPRHATAYGSSELLITGGGASGGVNMPFRTAILDNNADAEYVVFAEKGGLADSWYLTNPLDADGNGDFTIAQNTPYIGSVSYHPSGTYADKFTAHHNSVLTSYQLIHGDTAEPPFDWLFKYIMARGDSGGLPTFISSTSSQAYIELLFFDEVLSDADRLRVEQYLDDTYDLGLGIGTGASTAPLNHWKDNDGNIVSVITQGQRYGLNEPDPTARLEVKDEVEPVRFKYDADNYVTIIPSSVGVIAFSATGSAPEFLFQNKVRIDTAQESLQYEQSSVGTNEMLAQFAADNTTWGYTPAPAGTPDTGEEFYYNFSTGQWYFDESIFVAGEDLVSTYFRIDHAFTEYIGMPTLGTPTYDDTQDFIDHTSSSGLTTGGVVTSNGDGTGASTAGTGYIRADTSEISELMAFNFDADASITLTDDALNFVYVDYNSGTPIIDATIDHSTLDHTSQFVISVVFRDGNELHITPIGQDLTNQFHRILHHAWEVEGLERASGLLLSHTGTRNLAISAGAMFWAYQRSAISAIDTSVSDTFSAWYRDGIGGWTEVTAQTQLDNLYWDDNTGVLNTTTVNKYCVHWTFLGFDGHIHTMYGRGDYTLGEADVAELPADRPNVVSSMCLYIGKVIVQQNASSFTSVILPWSGGVGVAVITDHTDLSSIGVNTHAQIDTFIAGGGSGDYNIDGGGPDSVYTPEQSIDGGGP